MLIKGNFTQLDDLAMQIMKTVGMVQQEMDTWRTTSGATAADWMDRAGGEFTAVSQAWEQVSTAQQSMLDALRGGVVKANGELQMALQSATARVQNVQI
ncbi:hypothetical protein [Allorhizocola rhizosphaerae]|uniref:hypothetical protein n=1 Tax=Allorhizocola rhizosphaerae TaxID=1872709 RepID=UPI000E3D746A|nr:hypothetical protein [Allorhizocola rhizosphaerae]